jgi:hypothetical protein
MAKCIACKEKVDIEKCKGVTGIDCNGDFVGTCPHCGFTKKGYYNEKIHKGKENEQGT